jgi:hypothetical protein
MGVQKYYKKWFAKNRDERFYKKSKTDFLSIFLLRFWAFLGEESSKTP